MKAFLSHSSKDKPLVEAVFEDLGAANCIYDAESFEEGKTSAEKIFGTLDEADLFVLFVSANSLASHWVKHELLVAHNSVAKGRIKGFQVFIPTILLRRTSLNGCRCSTSIVPGSRE
jgi:hypothetical protein